MVTASHRGLAAVRGPATADRPDPLLRTGKRMDQRRSEIVIAFKPVAHPMFPDNDGSSEPHKLVIQLQPTEGIRLHMTAQRAGTRRYPAGTSGFTAATTLIERDGRTWHEGAAP